MLQSGILVDYVVTDFMKAEARAWPLSEKALYLGRLAKRSSALVLNPTIFRNWYLLPGLCKHLHLQSLLQGRWSLGQGSDVVSIVYVYVMHA